MTEQEIRELAEYYIKKYIPDNGWKFEFNNRKKALGVCNYRKKTIYLSKYIIGGNEYEILDTILHEIAHVLEPGDGHGRKWKRKCVEIGASPNRTTDYILCKSKYVYVCETCGKVSSAHRKSKIKRSCGKCSPYYDERYLMVFKLREEL